MKKVLTIAGSDCSGGAGIQADLKTICAHKMYGMSAITALTAQNTKGVYAIFDTTPEFLVEQLDAIFTDIYPDSIKIGMVSNPELIQMIVEKLKQYDAKNIVVDPVMISTSGYKLLTDEAIDILTSKLIPLATVITPNTFEAEALSGKKITDEASLLEVAEMMYEKFATNILIKGGHLAGEDAVDVLYDGDIHRFVLPKVQNPNTHGTGCTLSSAIACQLADGNSLIDSIDKAKQYLHGALSDMLDLGQGSGPVNHLYKL